jgi:membrane associated rhomboid family serine protease
MALALYTWAYVPFPISLKQLILFSNRIIVYDFYHILISHHRIKLLLFLIVLRASEPHLSLLKRLIYYIKLSSRCQKINNLFR